MHDSASVGVRFNRRLVGSQNLTSGEMPFRIGNQEWRKRRCSRGGRPTRHEAAKKKALDEAKTCGLKRWAELRADWMLAGILGLDRGRCPLCEKIIKHHEIT